MRISIADYLSHIFIRARAHYRFSGVVVGKFGIGIFWRTKRETTPDSREPLLPGME